MDSKIVGLIVLYLLRAFTWVYYVQPRRLGVLWGNLLGFILMQINLRRKVVDDNLKIAFQSQALKTTTPAGDLAQGSYFHLGNLVLEILMLFGPMKRFCNRYATISGVEHWREAKAKGRGVIMLASHVGNWEIMAARGALEGIDIMLVTKHLKPEWLHQAVEKGRALCGVRATYEPRTLRDVLSHLKKNGTIGFVLDQYAGPPVGVRVPVFGIPVGTQLAVATLVKRTGAVVLPVVNHRTKDGRFHVEICKPLEWEAHPDASFELAANTARYAALLETHIGQYPEQWLWIHRRFKGDLSPLKADEWSQGRARQ